MRLLASSRLLTATSKVQLLQQPDASRQSWAAALPALTVLSQSYRRSSVSSSDVASDRQALPWPASLPAAALHLPGQPHRSFATRPKVNKRVQQALERKRKEQQRQSQATPTTYDAVPEPAESAAEAGNEIVPSEAPADAVDVSHAISCSSYLTIVHCAGKIAGDSDCRIIVGNYSRELHACVCMVPIADCKGGGPSSAHHHPQHRVVS